MTTLTDDVRALVVTADNGWTLEQLGLTTDPGCHCCNRQAGRYLAYYGALMCGSCWLAGWGVDR